MRWQCLRSRTVLNLIYQIAWGNSFRQVEGNLRFPLTVTYHGCPQKSEAAKLAPRWNPYLAQLYAQELGRGHANRATVQVARKLVAYLLAVDKSGQPFQVRTPPPKAVPTKKKTRRRLASAA
jgi:hypothetical protein